MNKEIAEVLLKLQDPHTIRSQAQRILALAKNNKLEHFSLHEEQLQNTADYVLTVILKNYPKLDVPYHSRWRHFEVGQVKRIEQLQKDIAAKTSMERGRILYELVIISVFLDAGAGPHWRYIEPASGKEYTRSEGLALASLTLYLQGTLSADPQEPLRVDAEALINFQEKDLNRAFQISPDNSLEGVTGRVALLNQLGKTLQDKVEYFGKEGRLGDFYSYVCSLEKKNSISASTLFQAVLQAFHSVWPERLVYQGVSLGDVWIHKALKTTEPGSEYIPFHKLSQWLTYSLIEPLELAGIQVNDLNELTGLPEYRNGGLLIDSGLLEVKNKAVLDIPQEPSSELVVEWRALTVALLDEIANLIRSKLQMDANALPLAKILQGGTWEAGRQIAKQKRPSGTPPLHIISDGTVF
ncbi:MAG: DUF1688 family protein [Legionella sp.]|nr:MAG: DUF1688 family protein [Legionella sp.]